MSIAIISAAIWTMFGWSLGMLTAMAIGKWLHFRDRKRKRQQAMDAACSELERGKA